MAHFPGWVGRGGGGARGGVNLPGGGGGGGGARGGIDLPGGGGSGGGAGVALIFREEAGALEAPGVASIFQLLLGNCFFSDGSEIREMLMQYVKPHPAAHPVTPIHVPGDARAYCKRSERARRATAALVAWFCDLHDLGYSLLGTFTRDSFGVDHLGYFRGDMSLLSLVTQNTGNSVNSNMQAIADIIHTDIHSSCQIPDDLAHLLKCLRLYNISFSPLVRKHASHEEEDVKSALFIRMHSRLKFIMEMDPPLYAKILQQIQQIPDSSVWLGKAMLNTHLHIVLRYTPDYHKQPRSVGSVVFAFLSSRVLYRENATGLLTCCRNGQAHMEADSSVDTIGYIEAALFGAAQGLNVYHQMQYSADVAAAVQRQQQVASVVPLATRLLTPMPQDKAIAVGQAVQMFLTGAQLSLDAAKAGAAAAASYVVRQANPSNRAAHFAMTQAAVGEGVAAAQGVQGGVPQARQPIDMFNANDIDHMYHVIAPNLLVGFQRVMFGEGERFRLGEDTKVPRLTT